MQEYQVTSSYKPRQESGTPIHYTVNMGDPDQDTSPTFCRNCIHS